MGVIIHYIFIVHFLGVMLMQLNRSAVKRMLVPSVLLFYLCLIMCFLFLMTGTLIVYH